MDIFSKKMESYFFSIKEEIESAYAIATQARKKGLDPEDFVETPVVENMAERVEGLISVVAPQIRNSGVSKRIKGLEEEYGSLNWRVALKIGLEVAKQKYCTFDDEQQAIEIGIRTGFAYLTMGVVASPLEGFVELKLRDRKDGKGKYFALFYAGPVRSAGGTGASVSVILADYIRKNMGYAEYDPTEEEARRGVTELYDYHDRITNLQYLPSEEEIYFLGKHLPVQIDGDGSEKIEVSNYKDLDRIETNTIRNGFCLTLGEGLAQKAEKLLKQLSKWGHDFGLEHWDWIKDFVDLKHKIHAKGTQSDQDNNDDAPKILANTTYIKDLVGGRPVFTHPMRDGGFRLRYGRSRTSGFSSYSIHPSTMFILDDYLAIGTQLKNERPGKGCTVTVCDSIEGPIVKLKDGSVILLQDPRKAKETTAEIEEILFLGDILINYGDFNDRGHILVPPGYCEEWWALELEKASVDMFGTIDIEKMSNESHIPSDIIRQLLSDPFFTHPSGKDTIQLSKVFNVPIHPLYSHHWNCISTEQLQLILESLKKATVSKDADGTITKLIFKKNDLLKRSLELTGIFHIVANNEYIVIGKDHAHVIYTMFDISRISSIDFSSHKKNIEYVNDASPYTIRDKSGIFIGARMGRPEKSKMRSLQGSPQVLFPIGDEGGRLRSFQSALEAKKVTSDFPIMHCPSCKRETIYRRCEHCKGITVQMYNCRVCGKNDKEECTHGKKTSYQNKVIDISSYFNSALKRINMTQYPDLIKGVRGTSNKTHEPEHIAKGILRAKYGIYVNKDGTTRYDMTQLPITHFKPKEIGTSIEKLYSLGYDVDIKGKKITDPDQVIELKPQDLILPKNIHAPEEGAHDILKRIADFIDDLLFNFYKQDPFYNIKTEEDLIGQIVLVLAPHTSGGIAGRIIGFSDTQGLFAHPMLHAATRRDCDGDEACVCLLLDVLLNFSRHFLPAHRGSTQDAPLVLTWKLTTAEVDDMVFNMDVVNHYPLEFYEACLNYKNPWDIKIGILNHLLGTERQYEGFGFTHPTSNLNKGVLCSAYKTIPTMQDKIYGQMNIAEKIRAVDTSDVARLVIEKHFLKDIKGNLRKFSMQQFRCVACNEKFRRPPLTGKCTQCSGRLIFTISHGSIIKYLEPSLSLAKKYDLPVYLKQTLDILQRMVDSVFGREKEKQSGLGEWF